MRKFMGLTKRNLLVYFKDKQSMVFSLLTSIIVLVLYLLFLKGSFVDSVESVLSQIDPNGSLVKHDDIDTFANMFLLSGILGSAMITVPYNCLTTIVKDRENRIDYDISATPTKRWQIILAYFMSATISAIIMTALILTVSLVALAGIGNLYMSATDILQTYGIVALGSVSATALFMIVVLFFKTTGASGAFFGILSAAAGFVIGAFVPISQFSDKVQTFCNLFPASHVTVLLRNTLLTGVLDEMDAGLGGIDHGMFAETMKDVFSFQAHLFGKSMDVSNMLLYIGAGIIICIGVMIIVYNKTYKRK